MEKLYVVLSQTTKDYYGNIYYNYIENMYADEKEAVEAAKELFSAEIQVWERRPKGYVRMRDPLEPQFNLKAREFYCGYEER